MKQKNATSIGNFAKNVEPAANNVIAAHFGEGYVILNKS